MIHQSYRKDLLKNIRRIVIKIGSGVLTSCHRGLDLQIFEELAKETALIKSRGYEPIIVSSGAIAAGMERLGLVEKPRSIPQKQAAAAVGQSTLMWSYERSFAEYGQKVAQVLLTHDDLSDRTRFLNARNTILTLINHGIIPIINENDSVAVEEIKFGDNDNLSALITNLVQADLLIILTNTEGLYDKDPCIATDSQRISIVPEVNSEIEKAAGDTMSEICVGGMITKVQAAKKAAIFGLSTVVANGKVGGVINRIINGEDVGTLFLPKKDGMASRKHWIAFAVRPKGEIIVDKGAQRAIVDKGKSLLPSGILDVRGRFAIGDSVGLMNPDGCEFAKGLVNYDSSEIIKIKGLKTIEIEDILGYRYYDEIIHRDDLVVL